MEKLKVGDCVLFAAKPNVYVLASEVYPEGDTPGEPSLLRLLVWNSKEIRVIPENITSKGHTIAVNKVCATFKLGLEVARAGKKLKATYNGTTEDIAALGHVQLFREVPQAATPAVVPGAAA